MVRNLLFSLLALMCTNFLFSQDFSGKVTVFELAQKQSEVFPDADIEILQEHQDVYFDFSNVDLEFKVVEVVTRKIKLYDKQAANKASFIVGFVRNNYVQEQVSLEFANVYELVGSQIKKNQVDSKWIVNPTNEKEYKEIGIDFSKVNSGSIIEYQYVKVTNYFDVLPIWQIQGEIPKIKSSFTSVIPEYYNYEFVSNGKVKVSHNQESVMSNFSKSRQYLDRTSVASLKTTLQAQNIAGYPIEPYVNNVQNYLSYVKMDLVSVQYPYSSKQVVLQSESEFLKSLVKNRNFFGQIEQNSYYKKHIDKAAYLLLPPKERADKILELVQSKVKWNKQFSVFSSLGAKTAFNKGVGSSADINFILISMLNYVDLPAMPLLLSTKDNGIKSLWQTNYYNNTIVVAQLDNKYYFMDASSPVSSVGLLPLEDLNGVGQAISKQGELMQFNMVPEFLSTNKESYQLEVNTDGSITGSMLSTYQGYFSMWFNQMYREIGVFGFSQNFTQEHFGLRLSNIDVSIGQSSSENVRVTAKVFKQHAVEHFNNKLFVNAFDWFSLRINPFTAKQRVADISFDFPSTQVYNVSLAIPKGYKVSKLPKEVQYKSQGIQMSYSTSVTLKDTSVDLQLVLVRGKAQIPSEDYLEVQSLFENMQTSLQEHIVFELDK